MKNLFNFIVTAVLVILSISCKKDPIEPEPDFAAESYAFAVSEDRKYHEASSELSVTEKKSLSLFVTFEKHPGAFTAQSFYDVELKLTVNPDTAIADAEVIRHGSSCAVEVRGNYPGETAFTVEAYLKSDGTLILRRSFKVNVTEFSDPDLSEAVDLGLSVKWAPRNVGAKTSADSGLFFAWGETEQKTYYGWSKPGDYKWGVLDSSDETNYGMVKYTSVDGFYKLLAEDDPATVICGRKWRTPTKEEANELLDESKCEWTWDAGRQGCVVRSLINGNSIFLPAAGFYSDIDNNIHNKGSICQFWLADLSQFNPAYAYYFIAGISTATREFIHESGRISRNEGSTVRAVTEY